MAASRSLRRLLEVLRIQEEQARRAAAEATAETQRLRTGLDQARARECAGRRLVTAGAHSGSAVDRVAGLEEVRIARRVEAMLSPRVAWAEGEEQQRRQQYLARRTERRQAETLLEATERNAVREESRRAQQLSDELHLDRRARDLERSEG